MVDPQNLVSFVERALLLKTLPVLDAASADQIAAILSHAEERSFVPGAQIFRPGEAPTQIHVLVEGRARCMTGGAGIVRRPGEVIGLLDALEHRPHRVCCISETAVQTLTVRVDDLLDLLEDFFDLARALLGLFARRAAAKRAVDGLFDGDATAASASARLDLIDKIILMKAVPILAGASVNELAALAEEIELTAYRAGDVVVGAGQPAAAFHIVVDGGVGPHGARGCVGALDVLADGPYRATLSAGGPTRVLRVPAERFFDLLEDHFDMTIAIARRLAGAVRFSG